ncbi:MAG: succinylglutamate desuccinylase/aspartoacylase family protein [Gammaproteobacteria bacterium]|nr:succinylglutamate desuccinylase/aspartoacylase family protein [Gammaproteobacteria bacterium]
MQTAIEIAGTRVSPGSRQSIDIPLPSFYTHSSVNMPVHVVHGRQPGPVLLVSAAVHGDEINGVEIIRRLLTHKFIDRIKGTLIAIPVVNVYGFVSKSRYLPDRRDLNRSFPGTEYGSMAARLANVVMTEILPHCTHIIDLHTGAVNRENLPQIRANLVDDPSLEALAQAFGVPVILNAQLLEGSFRAAAHANGIGVLLYEAGEALRFDEVAIRAGVRGVLQVMTELDMRGKIKKNRQLDALVANTSRWVRAGQSGILRSLVATGSKVEIGDLLAYINNPLGENSEQLISPVDGIVIGKTNLPLVFAGEALFNIASYEAVDQVAENIDAYNEELDPNTDSLLSDEPPLV